jgi:tripartite-type tricarboxylate transporter receptor subunit TctC
VRIIVPFPAGGSNDTLCRIVADKLSDAWKQPVIVDNKAGAGGNIGAEIVYGAAGDGYTLLCSPPGPLSINHNLYKTLPYDWSKFVPVTVLALNVITARKDLPANSAQELIAYARANPGKVTCASQGNSSTSHLSAQVLATQAGLDMVHVPYKGEGPALIDITAGRVDIFVGNISAALALADVRAKFLEQGAEPQGDSPPATAAFIKEEEARWRAVIKSANVTLE